jgi:AraC-like DNA-binding protein
MTALDPPGALAEAVAALHLTRTPRAGAPYRRLPMPWTTLVVTLGETGCWRGPGETDWRPFPRVALCGFTTAWMEARDPDRGPAVYAIALIHPWAVQSLLGVRAPEAAGRVLDMQALQPAWAQGLAEALRAAPDAMAALRAFADALAARPRGPGCDPRVLAYVESARATAGAVSVAEAAARGGLSERAFRDLFRAAVGLAPKHWAIIERFAANLRRLHAEPWAGPPEEEPDYFDQSHELREFKRLSGVTPGQYRRMKRAGDSRVFAVDIEPVSASRS